MNGIHDMGGMHGFGPIEAEAEEVVFHHAWEGRVLAMVFSLGRWSRGRNWPWFRFVLESLPPVDYLRMSYYERWHEMNVLQLRIGDLLTETEIESGRADPGRPQPQLMEPEERPTSESSGVEVSARFRPEDRVRARNLNPRGHTRLPRYARGREGVVTRDHGPFAVQDTDAAGQRLDVPAEHVYTVRFAARELWGDTVPGRDAVYLDLWERYLEPA